MDIVRVNNVSEFISNISNIIRNSKGEFYEKNEFLYRGQIDKDYELIPSLGRYKHGCEDLCFVERNMIEMAKYKMPEVFTVDLNPLDLLAVLQHYGIPTRLLDITENALVALYFACESGFDRDGEVLIFKNDASDVVNWPIVNAIADSYRFSRGSIYSLTLFYKSVIQQPYFLEQKNQLTHKDDNDGAKWIKECCETPFFVHSMTRLRRQQIQKGRYILFHNKIKENEDEDSAMFFSKIEAMSKNDECVVGRIIVPARVKQTMLDEMRLLGIDRGILFADSVDIVCQEIKKKFYDTNLSSLYAGYKE